ncbi:MAG: tRNA (adenosine(37)-N6)-threonylcarbamoyltransferase complex ATPase subunit type 1 TsaE [Clostridia bacterium]|nr:tRNA (adenosine(37)-N6)-threonylcarbamoyltransferase complex ATPase subunit type 1 TsaE [Clostridia bacterium]
MTLPESRASLSPSDTEAFGEELARLILNDSALPRFVALYGDLGVGKTAFVRGFTKAIAPEARVKSPTFALVNQYKGSRCSVFHFDMYRIESEDDLYSIGFYDYMDGNGICLVEWSENIEYALPDVYFRVEIIKDSSDNADSRRIDADIVGL